MLNWESKPPNHIDALVKKPHERVTIEKLSGPVQNSESLKVIYLKVLLAYLFRYENITKIHEIFIPFNIEHNYEIYLITKHYPCTLKSAITSIYAKLNNYHIQDALYLLIKAVHFFHSAGIFNLDLNPKNILLDSNFKPNFVFDVFLKRNFWNNDVDSIDLINQELYYMAPELFIGLESNKTSANIWSIGCIMLEVINQATMFPYDNSVEMLLAISCFRRLTHNDELLLKDKPGILEFYWGLVDLTHTWKDDYLNIEDDALDLIDNMITFNPEQRYTTIQCLQHPYFSDFYEEDKESIFNGDFSELYDVQNISNDEIISKIYDLANEINNKSILKS